MRETAFWDVSLESQRIRKSHPPAPKNRVFTWSPGHVATDRVFGNDRVVVRSLFGELPDSFKAVPDPSAAEEIKKLEQDIGDAMVAVDLEKLNQAYADDFATIGSSGKLFCKEDLLDDFKSGEHKLVSFELGPVNVQAFGNVAVAQAGVKEKRIQDGKDYSGQFAFVDLFKKRSGKWVIVRTLSARPS